MSTKSLIETYNSAREMLHRGPLDNLARVADPDARSIDTSVSTSRIESGASISKVVMSRRNEPLRDAAYVAQITKSSYQNIVADTLKSLQTIITDVDNPQNSRLVTTMSDFYSQSNILNSDTSPPMRQAFINSCQNLAQVFTESSAKVTSLKADVDSDLQNSALNANRSIKALSQLNQQIIRSPMPIVLYDQRDALIRDLAQNFDVRVRFGDNGIAIVSMPNGAELVSNSYYAQFDYAGMNPGNGEIPPLNAGIYQSSGELLHSITICDKSQSINLISGGKWQGLLDLRDRILPDAGKIISTLSNNFVKTINDIHNNGSTTTPQAQFTSNIQVYGQEILDFKGNFNIYAVDASGAQLSGGAGLLNVANIDLQGLSNSLPGQAVRVMDVINEINEKLNFGPSRIRACIGAIQDENASQINSQYLINNIQIAGTSNIENGTFSFDLDLQGSSYFGSNVEILGVTGPNGPLSQNQLPSAFRLEKDTNSRTGYGITVDGFNAAGPQNLTIDIRVTGDNGQVNIGKVTFSIDSSQPNILNKRISFDGTAGNMSGNFVSSTSSHSGVASARIVDDNGQQIDPNSGQRGTLVIQTNDSNYRLVIQGGNFSSVMGFSNLFNLDPATGATEVNPKIAANVSYLNTGQVSRTSGNDILVKTGDVKAASSMVFSAIPQVGDTVTIDGEVFTFEVAASGTNQIAVANGLDGLVAAINNHPLIKSRVSASVNALTLNVTAGTAGLSGNSIAVAANLGAVTVDINGVGAAGNVNGTLLGGTDKTGVIKQYQYNIGSSSSEVLTAINATQSGLINIVQDGIIPQMVVSLPNLATIVTGLLSNQVNDADFLAKVNENVLKEIDKQIKNDYGINKEEQYEKALDATRYLTTLAHLMRMVQKNTEVTESILFRD